MNKVLATALALTLSVGVLTSPVLADNQETEQAPKNVLAGKIQAPEEKIIEGTIQEIQDHAWIVADQDGKEYTVPIFGFEQLEDYKKLDPTVGTKVTLKGNSLNLANGPVKIFRTAAGIKGDEDAALSETVTVFKLGNKEGIVELDKEDILKIMSDKETGGIHVVKAIPAEEGMNLTEKDFAEISEKAPVLKMKGEEGIIELDKEEILKRIKDEGVEIGEAVKGIPVEGNVISMGKDFLKELKGDLFTAHEITVGGMTLKLPAMKIAIPALPATEKVEE
ncbi:hypothetical protein HNQ80_001404 [Anaerosolibacter carboniphilus]|uniref:DUF5666 domain-containing protein n=1 Tax=Anaerosolibacter carboniphilus TaxID=1417629 RepID=A0A841KYV9_9FIRM|nr:hypothetical protein [Anaerosolibacter carboniphilus]MBB6215315.1 hypothetical protein [Anaerosolibacter carboniphilus]